PKVTMCPLCNTSALNLNSAEPPNYNSCTECRATVCKQCGFNPNPHLSQVEWLCLNCQMQRALGAKPTAAAREPTPHAAGQPSAVPESRKQPSETDAHVQHRPQPQTQPQPQHQSVAQQKRQPHATPADKPATLPAASRADVEPQKSSSPHPPDPRQPPETKATAAPSAPSAPSSSSSEAGVAGKLFGFGANLFSQATTIMGAVNAPGSQPSSRPGSQPPSRGGSQPPSQQGSPLRRPATPGDPRQVAADEARGAHPASAAAAALGQLSDLQQKQQQQKPQQQQAVPDVSAKPKVTCPLCGEELNVGGQEPANYSTCTGCRAQVCNLCGFNPCPHLPEKTSFACLNCQKIHLLQNVWSTSRPNPPEVALKPPYPHNSAAGIGPLRRQGLTALNELATHLTPIFALPLSVWCSESPSNASPPQKKSKSNHKRRPPNSPQQKKHRAPIKANPLVAPPPLVPPPLFRVTSLALSSSQPRLQPLANVFRESGKGGSISDLLDKPYSRSAGHVWPTWKSLTDVTSQGIFTERASRQGCIECEVDEMLDSHTVANSHPPHRHRHPRLRSSRRPSNRLLKAKGCSSRSSSKTHGEAQGRDRRQRPRSLSITPESYSSGEEDARDTKEVDEGVMDMDSTLRSHSDASRRESLDSLDEELARIQRHDMVEDSSESTPSPLPYEEPVQPEDEDEDFIRRQLLEMSADEGGSASEEEEEDEDDDDVKGRPAGESGEKAYQKKDAVKGNEAKFGQYQDTGGLGLAGSPGDDVFYDKEPELEMESLTDTAEDRSQGDGSSSYPAASSMTPGSGTSPSVSSLEEDSDGSPSRRRKPEEVKKQRKPKHHSHGPQLPTIEDSSEEDELREEEELLKEQEKLREQELQQRKNLGRKSKRDKEELRAQRRRRSRASPSNLSPIEDASPTEELRQAAEMEELHRSSCSEYSPSIESEPEGFEVYTEKLYKLQQEFNMLTAQSLSNVSGQDGMEPGRLQREDTSDKLLRSAEEVYEEMMRKARLLQSQHSGHQEFTQGMDNSQCDDPSQQTDLADSGQDSLYSMDEDMERGSHGWQSVGPSKSSNEIYDEISQRLQELQQNNRSYSTTSLKLELRSKEDKKLLDADAAYDELMKRHQEMLTPGTSPTQPSSPMTPPHQMEHTAICFPTQIIYNNQSVPAVQITQHFSTDDDGAAGPAAAAINQPGRAATSASGSSSSAYVRPSQSLSGAMTKQTSVDSATAQGSAPSSTQTAGGVSATKASASVTPSARLTRQQSLQGKQSGFAADAKKQGASSLQRSSSVTSDDYESTSRAAAGSGNLIQQGQRGSGGARQGGHSSCGPGTSVKSAGISMVNRTSQTGIGPSANMKHAQTSTTPVGTSVMDLRSSTMLAKHVMTDGGMDLTSFSGEGRRYSLPSEDSIRHVISSGVMNLSAVGSDQPQPVTVFNPATHTSGAYNAVSQPPPYQPGDGTVHKPLDLVSSCPSRSSVAVDATRAPPKSMTATAVQTDNDDDEEEDEEEEAIQTPQRRTRRSISHGEGHHHHHCGSGGAKPHDTVVTMDDSVNRAVTRLASRDVATDPVDLTGGREERRAVCCDVVYKFPFMKSAKKERSSPGVPITPPPHHRFDPTHYYYPEIPPSPMNPNFVLSPMKSSFSDTNLADIGMFSYRSRNNAEFDGNGSVVDLTSRKGMQRKPEGSELRYDSMYGSSSDLRWNQEEQDYYMRPMRRYNSDLNISKLDPEFDYYGRNLYNVRQANAGSWQSTADTIREINKLCSELNALQQEWTAYSDQRETVQFGMSQASAMPTFASRPQQNVPMGMKVNQPFTGQLGQMMPRPQYSDTVSKQLGLSGSFRTPGGLLYSTITTPILSTLPITTQPSSIMPSPYKDNYRPTTFTPAPLGPLNPRYPLNRFPAPAYPRPVGMPMPRQVLPPLAYPVRVTQAERHKAPAAGRHRPASVPPGQRDERQPQLLAAGRQAAGREQAMAVHATAPPIPAVPQVVKVDEGKKRKESEEVKVVVRSAEEEGERRLREEEARKKAEDEERRKREQEFQRMREIEEARRRNEEEQRRLREAEETRRREQEQIQKKHMEQQLLIQQEILEIEKLKQKRIHEELERDRLEMKQRLDQEKSRQVGPVTFAHDPAAGRWTPQMVQEMEAQGIASSHYWHGAPHAMTSEKEKAARGQGEGIPHQHHPRHPVAMSTSDTPIKDGGYRGRKVVRRRSSISGPRVSYDEDDDDVGAPSSFRGARRSKMDSGVQTDEEDTERCFEGRRRRARRSVDCGVQTDDDEDDCGDDWSHPSRRRRPRAARCADACAELDKCRPASKSMSSIAVQTIAHRSAQTEPDDIAKCPAVAFPTLSRTEIVHHISAPERGTKGGSLACQTDLEACMPFSQQQQAGGQSVYSKGCSYSMVTQQQEQASTSSVYRKRPAPLEIAYGAGQQPPDSSGHQQTSPKSPKVLYSPVSPIGQSKPAPSPFGSYDKQHRAVHVSPQKHAATTVAASVSSMQSAATPRVVVHHCSADTKPLESSGAYQSSGQQVSAAPH
uniref:Zinc finger piccolo-type domain-containing protein n=1 Tax=Petromyzon marinus TaxID=7757 RepID=S4RPS7_PETMA